MANVFMVVRVLWRGGGHFHFIHLLTLALQRTTVTNCHERRGNENEKTDDFRFYLVCHAKNPQTKK